MLYWCLVTQRSGTLVVKHEGDTTTEVAALTRQLAHRHMHSTEGAYEEVAGGTGAAASTSTTTTARGDANADGGGQSNRTDERGDAPVFIHNQKKQVSNTVQNGNIFLTRDVGPLFCVVSSPGASCACAMQERTHSSSEYREIFAFLSDLLSVAEGVPPYTSPVLSSQDNNGGTSTVTTLPVTDFSSFVGPPQSLEEYLGKIQDSYFGLRGEVTTIGPSLGRQLLLPICEVSIEGCLVGLMGSYTIAYTFRNCTELPLETTFRFPLWGQFPTLKGFSADMNGNLISGMCYRKERSFTIHNNPIASGLSRFLLEPDSDDVLQLSLGNLAPGAQAKILVECVTQLSSVNVGNGKQLRKFVIPSRAVYFFRTEAYKHSREGLQEHNINCWPLRLSLDIRMPCKACSIESPSHEAQILVNRSEIEGIANLRCHCDALHKEVDFSLVITVSETPTAVMYSEYSPQHNSTCIAVISPSVSAPQKLCSNDDATAQREIVRISPFVLTSIASRSFGTTFSLMHEDSVCYSQAELERATVEVTKMKCANMGSTQLLEPLVHVLGKPFAVDTSTRNVVVITNGAVQNTEEVLTAVSSARMRDSRCHVFALGIDGCSKLLIDGLAFSGDGASEYVRVPERIETKVMSLVKTILQDRVTKQTFTWSPRLNVLTTFPEGFRVKNNCTTMVFGLISGRVELNEDSAITEGFSFSGELRGTACNSRSALHSNFFLSDGDMLHCLGVWEQIKELESSFTSVRPTNLTQQQLEHSNLVVELSTKYKVLSTLTTYVAVQQNSNSTNHKTAINEAVASNTMPSSGEGKRGCLAFYTFKNLTRTTSSRKVHHLDGTVRTVNIDSTRPLKEAIKTLLDRINLTSVHDYCFFEEGSSLPLDSHKSLLEQAVDPDSFLRLKKKDYGERDLDPGNMPLMYQQIRDQVIQGTLFILDRNEMIQLASLDAQVTIGVFDPSQEKSLKRKLLELLPAHFQKQKHISKDIAREWEKHGNLDPRFAKLKYIQRASSQPTFGMSVFPAKVRRQGSLKDIIIGVSSDSIREIDLTSRDVIHTYSLSHIKRWGDSASSMTLDFGKHGDDLLNVITKDGAAISRLISSCTYTLAKMNPDSFATPDSDAISTTTTGSGGQTGHYSSRQVIPNYRRMLAAGDKLLSVVMLQNANGSWPATESVASSIGVTLGKVLSAIPPLPNRHHPEQPQQQPPQSSPVPSPVVSSSLFSVDVQEVWMTNVVLAFIERDFDELREEWDLLVEKSHKWVERQSEALGIMSHGTNLQQPSSCFRENDDGPPQRRHETTVDTESISPRGVVCDQVLEWIRGCPTMFFCLNAPVMSKANVITFEVSPLMESITSEVLCWRDDRPYHDVVCVNGSSVLSQFQSMTTLSLHSRDRLDTGEELTEWSPGFSRDVCVNGKWFITVSEERRLAITPLYLKHEGAAVGHHPTHEIDCPQVPFEDTVKLVFNHAVPDEALLARFHLFPEYSSAQAQLTVFDVAQSWSENKLIELSSTTTMLYLPMITNVQAPLDTISCLVLTKRNGAHALLICSKAFACGTFIEVEEKTGRQTTLTCEPSIKGLYHLTASFFSVATSRGLCIWDYNHTCRLLAVISLSDATVSSFSEGSLLFIREYKMGVHNCVLKVIPYNTSWKDGRLLTFQHQYNVKCKIPFVVLTMTVLECSGPLIMTRQSNKEPYVMATLPNSDDDGPKSKIRVVILYYSLTGNTRHTAEKIAQGLQSLKVNNLAVFTTRVFPVVPVIRETYFGGPPPPQNCGSQALGEALAWAQVIGCGTLCVTLKATGGISQFLCDLPPSLVAGKPGFVFTTAGQGIGESNATLAESLAKAGVKPVLSQWELLLCPDTGMWFLPKKPKRLLWGSNVIEKATAYGKQLGVQLQQYFLDGRNATSVVKEGVTSHIRSLEEDRAQGRTVRRLLIPAIICDTAHCVKCGKCAHSCPTNSMTFSKGEFPVWRKDSCSGCTACIANCPAEALYVENMRHKQYWRFREDNVREGDNNWSKRDLWVWALSAAIWRIASSTKLRSCFLLSITIIIAALALVFWK
ncbi:actin binding protein [Pelomyxa schiedti]|nr:actin binding protein [Pelomyxa schiedti]